MMRCFPSGGLAGRRWCFLVAIYCLFGSIDAFHSASDDVCFDLQPETVYVEEGATLRLNCSSSPRSMACNSSTHDITQVRFRRWDGRAAGAILDGDVSVTEQGHVVQFAKQKAQLNNDGKIVCALETEENVLLSDAATIVVQRRPLQPTIDYCVVFYYERLMCKWSPNSTVQKNYTHVLNEDYLSPTVSWTRQDRQDRNGSSPWQQCTPDDTGGPCSVIGDKAVFSNVTNDAILDITAVNCFRVAITNHFLNIFTASNVTCFRPVDYAVVRPTSVSQVLTISSTRVKIIWQKPRSRYSNYGNVSLVYRVSVTSSWSPQNATVIETGTESVELVTVPFTNYSVTVIAKPTQLGYWSRPGSAYMFNTPPTVPCQQPRVAADVEYVTVDNDTDTVVLYWKPVPQFARCGPGFHYRVQHRIARPTTTDSAAAADWRELDLHISSTSNSVAVPLSAVDTSGPMQFTVVAWNSLGVCSDLPTDIVDVNVTSSTAPQPYVVVESFGSSVTVHWLATDDDVTAASFTVYWMCRSANRDDITCTDSFNWFELESMDQAVSSYTFNVVPGMGDVINAQYQFGVAATVTPTKSEPLTLTGTGIRTGVRTGIHWADCMYSDTGPASPPRNVRATPSGYFALDVKWFGPNCEQHGVDGRIVHYIVAYCSANSQGKCDADVTERQVPAAMKAGSMHNCVLSGLQDNAKYRVTVYSLTAAAVRSRDQVFAIASTKKHWASRGIIAAIVTVAIVVLLSAIVSCSAAIKTIKRSRQLTISVPAPVVELNNLSQSDLTMNDYQSTWVDMERHGSDKSSRSRDSGWFDCPRTPSSTVDDSTCPLLSPTSTVTGSCVPSPTDSCFVASSPAADITNCDWRGAYVSHDDVTDPSSAATTTSTSSSCYVDHDVMRQPATGETFVGSEDYSCFALQRPASVTPASSPFPLPPVAAAAEPWEIFTPVFLSSPLKVNSHDVGQYQPHTALLQNASHFSFSPTSPAAPNPQCDQAPAGVPVDDVNDMTSELRRHQDIDVTATCDDSQSNCAENVCHDRHPPPLCQAQMDRLLPSPDSDVSATATPSECQQTSANVMPSLDDMIDKYVTLEDVCRFST